MVGALASLSRGDAVPVSRLAAALVASVRDRRPVGSRRAKGRSADLPRPALRAARAWRRQAAAARDRRHGLPRPAARAVGRRGGARAPRFAAPAVRPRGSGGAAVGLAAPRPRRARRLAVPAPVRRALSYPDLVGGRPAHALRSPPCQAALLPAA